LIALAPDVILAAGSMSVMALQHVTRSLPIVFVGVVDPVRIKPPFVDWAKAATARKRPELGRYLLQVDRQTKGSYTTSNAVQSAALAIKTGHPVVQVSVRRSQPYPHDRGSAGRGMMRDLVPVRLAGGDGIELT
jgi:hypothetical protein